MNQIEEKFFALLRLSLGVTTERPVIAADEWALLFAMAQKQQMAPLLFDGVRTMGDQATIDGDLLMRWMGKSVQMERRNRLVDEAVGKVSAWFERKGFATCLLKGQGNARFYPHAQHRTAGDIDIWLAGSVAEIIRFVHRMAPGTKASYHHVEFPSMDGVDVEVHYRPCYLHNPWHNHRLQTFFRRQASEQFAHRVVLGGASVGVPTASFNAVYQMVHIFNHLFQEGIGLRQVVDYYFVLRQLSAEGSDREAVRHELHRLGLWSFAGAVMYVLRETLAIPASRMIVPEDARRGRLLLADILRGGNFGRHGERTLSAQGSLGHNVERFRRDLRLVRFYPAEALAEPFFRVWHYVWRLTQRADTD